MPYTVFRRDNSTCICSKMNYLMNSELQFVANRVGDKLYVAAAETKHIKEDETKGNTSPDITTSNSNMWSRIQPTRINSDQPRRFGGFCASMFDICTIHCRQLCGTRVDRKWACKNGWNWKPKSHGKSHTTAEPQMKWRGKQPFETGRKRL